MKAHFCRRRSGRESRRLFCRVLALLIVHAPCSPFKFEHKFDLRAKLVIKILLILSAFCSKFVCQSPAKPAPQKRKMQKYKPNLKEFKFAPPASLGLKFLNLIKELNLD